MGTICKLPKQLIVGNVHRFQLVAHKNGSLWDLSNASVQLVLVDPLGNLITRQGSVNNGPAGMAFYDTNPMDLYVEGYWTREWHITDSNVDVKSRYIDFTVYDVNPYDNNN